MFQSLLTNVGDIVAGMGDGVGEIERISAFTDAMLEAYKARPSANEEPFPNFFDHAYAAYLAAITRADYFLSDIELLALSHVERTSIVIFRHCFWTRTH